MKDTPRTQLTPPDAADCVLPGDQRQCSPREVTASSENSADPSRIWLRVYILYIGDMHTYKSSLTSHSSTEKKSGSLFPAILTTQAADWMFLGISKGYFLKDSGSH